MDKVALFQLQSTGMPASLPARVKTNGEVNGEVSGTERGEASRLKEAAMDFEAMMIEQMLKSMRQADEALSEDSLVSSREQGFWQEWQDSRLALDMSRTQGIGLAEQIVRQVERQQGGG